MADGYDSSFRHGYVVGRAGQDVGVVGGASTNPSSAPHSFCGFETGLFWGSVSLFVKWGIKEVKHSKRVLSHISILITGSK